MWTASFRHREAPEPCKHEQVNITNNAGLQRTVCGDCGHVSLGYLYDTFEGLADQIPDLVDQATVSDD
ncbi:MAG: hypothetical protein L0Z49_00780 [Actinobacteria bacterium]|nr:hypothetical protein [Actinomycetota bacterium]